MTTSSRPPRPRVTAKSNESVTPLELFFDLVFVYALTQVTALLATHLSMRGLLEGMVVLALVWWCWVGFSWLGNAVVADEGATRVFFIAVMAVMFVASIAIPESYVDLPGGLSGPMVFAVCYALVRYIHLGLYGYVARSGGDRDLSRTLFSFGAVASASIALMIAGAAVGGTAQLVLWIGAIAIDYVGTQLINPAGWRLSAPRHFSERHGLIVLIALGESIVSIGVGATDYPVAVPLIVAAVLGIVVSAMLWWLYFDVTALAAEHILAESQGRDRTARARDAYSYLHLPMVAGVVLLALGLKKSLSYISTADDHTWRDSLHGIPLWALHLGPALYLLALVAFRYRNVGTFGTSRPVAAVLLVVSAPLGGAIGVLTDLGVVAAILIGLVVFEAVRFAETRHHIRHGHELDPTLEP